MMATANGLPSSRAATRFGGWSLIVAAVGFMGVFSWLAARFGYPDVLDGSAADVLPKLLSLGDTGRAVWVIYALLPLLLIPGGIAALAALESSSPNAARGALVGAVIASISMLVGLARWPSVHWELAQAYGGAGPEARQAMDAVFLGLNAYLGNFIGEFLGELALNLFFFATGVAALRSAGAGRWFAYAGMAVGVIGWIAALRNTTTAVSPIAEVNNYILPIWLIVLGVVLIRWRAESSGASTGSMREAA
jgi:hypothetical protein